MAERRRRRYRVIVRMILMLLMMMMTGVVLVLLHDHGDEIVRGRRATQRKVGILIVVLATVEVDIETIGTA